jgi:hypothetical protein
MPLHDSPPTRPPILPWREVEKQGRFLKIGRRQRRREALFVGILFVRVGKANYVPPFDCGNSNGNGFPDSSQTYSTHSDRRGLYKLAIYPNLTVYDRHL